jgi:predicted transcriptional regulator
VKTPEPAAVTAVCIDDFALKKRQRYGTVMVDLQTHKIIDMIESREAGEVKAWLMGFPNIQAVSRDGSQTYVAAVRTALPKAIQISDRFHLLKNLNERAASAFQKIFQGRVAIPITETTRANRTVMLIGIIRQRMELVKELRKQGYSKDTIAATTGASLRTGQKYLDMPEKDIPLEKQVVRGREHEEAVEKLHRRAELARELQAEGLSITRISHRTGFTYNTVCNYLSGDFSPVNAHYGKQREGKLAPYRKEVLSLKADGLKYREIHELLKGKGYTGTQDAIRGFVSQERRIQRDLLDAGAGASELIDRNRLIRLLYLPLEKVKGLSQAQFAAVMETYPIYKNILDIANEFKAVLGSKNPQTLIEWKNRAAALGIVEINAFIEGIKQDYDAVVNAVMYDYSNGLAEGTVNKIKVIKRIMYGRCRFPLLKNKCLLLDYLP